MRYLFVSDIHGCYDKLIKALTDAGFDAQNDTLVSVGDPFDRGSQNKEVLDFLLDTPHHILLWGNHDKRLRDLVLDLDQIHEYDYQNGIAETFLGLAGTAEPVALAKLRFNDRLMQYFKECHFAAEFKDLIVTHGWLPHYKRYDNYNFKTDLILNCDWRHDKCMRFSLWEDALWANTEYCITKKIFPEKRMLIGHWHAWRLAEKFGEKRQENKHDKHTYINCDTYIHPKFIAIDGCSNWPYGGKVNVFEYFSDEPPILYP